MEMILELNIHDIYLSRYREREIPISGCGCRKCPHERRERKNKKSFYGFWIFPTILFLVLLSKPFLIFINNPLSLCFLSVIYKP